MPICPYCGAEVQPEDIVCGNCGGDLPVPVRVPVPFRVREATELEEIPTTEEEMKEEWPSPPEAKAPAWISPTSRTLWIVVVVALLMLLCCCGILGLIALARILGQGPALPPPPLL